MYEKWFEENEKKILEDFFTFLKFKSISTDPAYASEMKRASDWLKSYLENLGLKVDLWKTKGYPILFATDLSAGPDRPTILLYHHYDVQPVDPVELWQSPPFEPQMRNGAVFARGAEDSKGQCFYSITAIKAFLALKKKFNFNLKVFIEGEEECGSEGMLKILPEKEKQLFADHLFVVDCYIPAKGSPAVTIGVRGIATMEITLKNSSTDLHSGSHGGIALSPNRALAELLAKCHDSNGKVAIPGFYDEVIPLTAEEKKEISNDFNLEQYQKEFGVKAFSNPKGTTFLEANWLMPTFEINGISGGYTGPGFKTVIPKEAKAKISCRLVPDQDPTALVNKVAQFLKAHVAPGIEITIQPLHETKALRTSPLSSTVTLAKNAYEKAFHCPCKIVLEGGTVPAYALQRASKAGVALIGTGLPTDNIHAPNEHFTWDSFKQGFLVICNLFESLS